MNRGYVINDDIAIVSNEIREQDIREATLNLKEVLVKENEKEKEMLEKKQWWKKAS